MRRPRGLRRFPPSAAGRSTTGDLEGLVRDTGPMVASCGEAVPVSAFSGDYPELVPTMTESERLVAELVTSYHWFLCGAVAARVSEAVPDRILHAPDCSDWLAEQRAERAVDDSFCPDPLADAIRPLAGRYGAEASAEQLPEAVGDLDAEVIETLNARQLESASKVPENVRGVDFLPWNALLPTCSAVAHHGGSGTCAALLEHGVGQLVIPSTFWNEGWFGPVALANGPPGQGAGVYAADSGELTAADPRGHLERMLTSPSEVAPALERLTECYRGR